jgi:3-phenylpropionate/trans-cinnamate dioxygenase ferredoxin reductase subunit
LPLARVLGREVATIYADLHRERGVKHVVGGVTALRGEKHIEEVRLAEGGPIRTQLVVLGLGAAPDLAMAEAAGLRLASGGVAVDEYLRSSDREIFAAGDVAAAWHPLYERRLRVEHWDNAIEQGKIAARNMLGRGVAYERRPYFYSDQFDLGMEYRGLPVDVDDVVLSGDVGSRTFCAFWLNDNRVVAAMNANIWDAGDRLQAMVEQGHKVDRAALQREGANRAEVVVA